MLADIISGCREDFLDGAQTELRAQRNRRRFVLLVNGEVTTNERTEQKGVSARVLKNGCYGFSAMADYSTDAARACLAAAGENASFLSERAAKSGADLQRTKGEGYFIKEGVKDAKQNEYIAFAKALDERVKALCPKIISREIVAVADAFEKRLVTSHGADMHILSPRAYVYVTLTGEASDGQPVEMFEIYGGSGTFDRYFTDAAAYDEKIETLYRRLTDKMNGVYPTAGLQTVILDGMMSGMLAHESVGHTVEADLVRGGSVAGSLLQKEVASPLVSMTDFAHTAFGAPCGLPVYVDDEGVVANDVPLIKDGVLQGFMHNKETAAAHHVAPTGNARAFLFSDEPLIRMRNTAVHPGKDKIEDMIASVDDGYYLVQSMNGQADLTGEFMFGVVCGYEIKNGKLGRALRDTTVSGVAFDMLKSVDMVSDNVTWTTSGYCGKKQRMTVSMGGPALRCKITMGGV